MDIVDAHSHLWLVQDTIVDGMPIRTLKNGRSLFFGEKVQMLPPFMTDGRNTAEVFMSNMDYAQVGKAVVVQEVIDGNQNEYLQSVQQKYADRFFCYGMVEYRSREAREKLAETTENVINMGFRGLAIPAHRLTSVPLNSEVMLNHFKMLENKHLYLSICLADDENQIQQMEDVISECPDLKIAIGHFGMATTNSWASQIQLARHKNVMVESGGITWLYNSEFYPYPSAVAAIRKAIDMVGADKLMWGSDYPRTITAITYKMSYDFVLKSNLLTDSEKELFMGQNAIKFYNLGSMPKLQYIKNMSE
ncbi:MAG: amidohydrolase [Bacteroidales bacterium]|nr:amidohydrolase [Bacteroidales bacterium]